MLPAWFDPVGLVRKVLEIARATPTVPHTEQGPLLIVDLYWQDLAGRPNWPSLLAHPNYVGAMLKATEGMAYHPEAIAWFRRNWRAVRAAAGDRYGRDFVRGAYHYLQFQQDGERQARFYLRTIEAAGGWGDGDIMPVLDVEFGKEGSSNRRASRSQVVDNVCRFVEHVHHETGRDVILYGGHALRELELELGELRCRYLWPASYTRTLKPRTYESIAPLSQVPIWQYTDGKVCKAVTTKGAALPRMIDGFGAVDCSVYIGGATVLDLVKQLVRPGPF